MRAARTVTMLLAIALGVVACHGSLLRPSVPADDPQVSYRLPVVAAPLMSAAPEIDGVVDRAEWTAAAQLAGLIALDGGLATDQPHQVFIGYTADALHIAFCFSRPPHAPPPTSAGDPLRVWRDDCMEMFLMPDPSARAQYNFVGNAAGLREEGIRTAATDKGWSAPWSYAARLTETGWEGELSIPFASLEVGTPDAGAVWAFTITNNQKTPRADPSSWSYLSDWNAPADFGYLVFGGEVPALRVRGAGQVSRSEAGASFEVVNFTGAARRVRVATELHRPAGVDPGWFASFISAADPLARPGEADQQVTAAAALPRALAVYRQLARQEQTLDLPAGQTRRVTMAQPAERGSYLLHYQVTDADTGAILAAGPLPFLRRAPLEVTLTPYVLSAGVVEVTADYRRVPGVAEGDRVLIELLPAEGGAALSRHELSAAPAAGLTVFDLPVREVAPGDYLVACALVGADGAERAARRADLHLAPAPEWWDHPVGHPEATDTVPQPWTPMERTGSGLRVWNRQVTLGAALQPAQILNGGVQMLTRPATLDLQLPGLTLGEAEVTLERRTGISYRMPITADAVSGELLLEAEFDGFMKYTLRLTPQAEGASLQRLALGIPLRPELARFYNHGSLGTPPSHAENTRRGDAGSLTAEGLALPFTPTTWVGDYEIGLNWCAETDRWWRPADPERAVLYQVGADATVLQINFVEQPRALSEPVQYQWALLPTPAKPLNQEMLRDLYLAQAGFRLNEQMTALDESTEAYIDAMVKGGVNAFIQWSWSGQAVWNDDFSMPAYRPTPLNEIKRAAFKRAIEMAHERGIKRVAAYVLWLAPSDWPGLGGFWNEMPLHPLIPMGNGYNECSAKPFADWHVYTLAQTLRDLGLDGVYLDGGASPRVCSNIHHGHGYYDDEGRLHGEYGFFSKREHLKRIYTLCHGEITPDGLVYVHHSGVFHPAIESFADIHHGGEGTDLNMDDFAGKFYGRPFGLPVTFTRWNVPWYPETRIRSWRLALLADATIKVTPEMVMSQDDLPGWRKPLRERMHRGYADNSMPVWLIWQAHQRFPWEGARWLPHWEIAPFVKVEGEGLYAAMHLQPGRAALLTVSSFRDEVLTVPVAVDWASLGFAPATVKVTDVITGEPVEVTEEGVTLEVLEQRFRLLEIRADG